MDMDMDMYIHTYIQYIYIYILYIHNYISTYCEISITLSLDLFPVEFAPMARPGSSPHRKNCPPSPSWKSPRGQKSPDGEIHLFMEVDSWI